MLRVFHENFVRSEHLVLGGPAARKRQINIVERLVGRALPLKADLPLQVLTETLPTDVKLRSKDEIAEELIERRLEEKVITLGKQIEYDIECNMIDFRPAKLERKIQFLMDRARKSGSPLKIPGRHAAKKGEKAPAKFDDSFTLFKLTKLVNKIA